eukprot:1178903-Prorocentrum_minimum.AAC.1
MGGGKRVLRRLLDAYDESIHPLKHVQGELAALAAECSVAAWAARDIHPEQLRVSAGAARLAARAARHKGGGPGPAPRPLPEATLAAVRRMRQEVRRPPDPL